MPSNDPFSTTAAFTQRTLTDAVNRMPYVPRRVQSMGLFEERGITTSGIMVEERDGVLNLVQTTPRGGVATQQPVSKRTARNFESRRVCLVRNINVDEVLNVRAFGSETGQQDLESFIRMELEEMVPSIDMTVEHLMLGALKGVIYDADGSTVIYNLFTEFGVSQESEQNFNFATATAADLVLDCNNIKRKIQDNLGAAQFDRIHAFCSPEFFDALVSNQYVRDTYSRAQGVHEFTSQIGGFLRESHVREAPFLWNGIWWEEYRGQLGGTSFIAANKAIFFPVGVAGLFKCYYAPADFRGGQGIGRPRYARMLAESPDGRSVPLEVSSYPLPICTRPKVLMKGGVS